MLKRARKAGLVPALVVSAVLAIALMAPASANSFLAAVSGCGYPNPVEGTPTVTAVSPVSGTMAGGTSVTITGTNFCVVTAVMFGTTPASSFVVNSRTSITAISPLHALGLVDVTVTNDMGTSPASVADHYTFTAPAGNVLYACSRLQYTLTGSDGATWVTTDIARLTVSITPSVDSYIILTGNADLWTSSAGFNQDLGIAVAGGTTPSYPTVAGQPQGWKESGGFAGTFSPNAAAVQTVITAQAGQPYSATLQWKANKADSGSIWAAAGPVAGQFSETCLVAQVVPVSSATVVTKVSTSQYQLTGNNGSTWQDLDATNLSLSFMAPAAGVLVLGGNADLWTANAGFNQDIAITVGGAVNAWKESGGFGGTFSPNAAFVQTVIPAVASTTYTAKLQWKTNKADSGTIFAGAGPVPSGSATYSPTRLTLLFLPTAQTAIDKVSTLQYTLTGNNGSSWVAVDPFTLVASFTPTVNCNLLISGNADLFTSTAGFNQDLGIAVVDTTLPTVPGQPEGWKESGGFAGTFSPNAAYVIIVVPLTGGHSYSTSLVWKANISDSGTIYAGAGPIGGNFSPTRLTLQPIGC